MNLDPTLSYEIDEKYEKKNNSINYRIEEAKRSSMSYTDFSNLNLSNIDFLLRLNFLHNIRHLFLNNNLLKGKIDLSKISNLSTIDLTSNEIEELIVPSTLVELTIENNLLSKLPLNINLSRLKCLNNKLEEIPMYSKLELLNASSNKIQKLNSYPNLRELTIIDNPLTFIANQPQLYFMDISKTIVSNIDEFTKNQTLKHLIANSSKLKTLPRIKSLQTIELINTHIERIHWFDNFELILCSYLCVRNMSNKYIENKANIQVRNSEICVSKKV